MALQRIYFSPVAQATVLFTQKTLFRSSSFVGNAECLRGTSAAKEKRGA
jgi:hypothetical protein